MKYWAESIRMSRFISIRRIFSCAVLVAIFVTSLCVVARANAASAVVFIDPPSQEVAAVGDSFSVNVSISGVSNLYGYDIKLYYNSTFLNGTQFAIGPFLNESGSFKPIFFDTFTDNYNSTEGVVWVSFTLTGPVQGVNGGGVLFTVKFKSLALSTSIPLSLGDVSLVDSNVSPIPYSLSDGTVTVVPEFTSLVLLMTLLAASIFAILTRKRAAPHAFR